MIDIRYDEALDILRCVTKGQSSLEEIEAFARKSLPLLERARKRRPHALYLIDAVEAVAHTMEVAARLAELAAIHTMPGDRNAIVIRSAVAKMQAARVTATEHNAYFENEADALTWLLSGEPGR